MQTAGEGRACFEFLDLRLEGDDCELGLTVVACVWRR